MQKEFKEDPLKAVLLIEQANPLTYDAWIYRIIVATLGLTIISILGINILIGGGKISGDEGFRPF
ncbi:MAG TPA: hypothetical protein VNE41_12530 [Chitinophagaceae bacterium]|nr:hypothetical protein [Chitinophagaceae bacterium]